MRIFSAEPDGNEAAELANAHYFNLAIELIGECNTDLKDSAVPYQVMLAHIDILVFLCNKYPVNANLLIKKGRVLEWKETFFSWYERVNKKIPKQFREGIYISADSLFGELEKFGYKERP